MQGINAGIIKSKCMKSWDLNTTKGVVKARELMGGGVNELVGESELGGHFIEYLSNLNIEHISIRGKKY